VSDLRGFLAAQRWHAGDEPPASVEVRSVEQLTDALSSILVETESGTYHVLDGPDDWAAVLARTAPQEVAGEPGRVRHMGVEQSNTSVVFDDRLVLKVFRRVHRGKNLEVEITDALSRAGFESVAEPLGVWEFDGYTKAVVQPFLAGGREGWELALASSAFADEAAEIGAVTAAMHTALASAFGTEAGDAEGWAAGIDSGLDRLESSEDEAAAKAIIDRLRSVTDPGPAQRVHGDYHLGQVMRTPARWYVLDFEGEPAREPAERAQPSSPMKDVTGMLRSFGYAAAIGGKEPRWETECRQAFLDAYSAQFALPEQAVLDAFELEKAVYELAYERSYRPQWVDVPRAAIRRLLEAL
jgi:maltokinase